jgi:hypothetical protein
MFDGNGSTPLMAVPVTYANFRRLSQFVSGDFWMGGRIQTTDGTNVVLTTRGILEGYGTELESPVIEERLFIREANSPAGSTGDSTTYLLRQSNNLQIGASNTLSLVTGVGAKGAVTMYPDGGNVEISGPTNALIVLRDVDSGTASHIHLNENLAKFEGPAGGTAALLDSAGYGVTVQHSGPVYVRPSFGGTRNIGKLMVSSTWDGATNQLDVIGDALVSGNLSVGTLAAVTDVTSPAYYLSNATNYLTDSASTNVTLSAYGDIYLTPANENVRLNGATRPRFYVRDVGAGKEGFIEMDGNSLALQSDDVGTIVRVLERSGHGLHVEAAGATHLNAANDKLRFTGELAITAGGTEPSSRLQVGGPIATAIEFLPTGLTLGNTNSTVLLTTASAVVKLPSASGIAGRIYTIKAINACTTGTVNTASTSCYIGDTGLTNIGLSASNKFVTLQCDGTNWWVIGSN